MRVLMLSLDKGILQDNSPVACRISALSAVAGEVVALAPRDGNKVVGSLRLWRQAKTLLRAKKFDLITVQDTAYLALLAYLLARKFRIPLEVQVHGLEKFYGVRKWLAGFVLRRVDKVRVVSERLKRFLTSNFQLPTPRLYVLPVYTQLSPRLQVRTEKGLTFSTIQGQTLKSSTFTFLTAGRLVSVKNVGLQIRAFARLVKEYPQIRLRIVGDGPLFGSLKSQVESLKLEDKIEFLGQQKEISRFYEEADAFLLTSDYEGWGLAVTEAAGFGLPIVMTDVGLAGEFIKNNENGMVIPVGNEGALVFAMRRIIEDADVCVRLGRAARCAFLALPSKEEQIQKQIMYWNAVLN